jgi:hypothetical protein
MALTQVTAVITFFLERDPHFASARAPAVYRISEPFKALDIPVRAYSLFSTDENKLVGRGPNRQPFCWSRLTRPGSFLSVFDNRSSRNMAAHIHRRVRSNLSWKLVANGEEGNATSIRARSLYRFSGSLYLPQGQTALKQSASSCRERL